ncbi:MAG: hypothetical protein Q9172_002770 [Xanthocarpia lactea]
MDQVYSRSTITISAASAHNADAGFLAQRCQQPRISLPFGHLNGITGKIFLAVCGSHRTTLPQDPLHLRSWPMQEHVLSPRVLVFEVEQMFWICNGSVFGNFDQVVKDGGGMADPVIARLNSLRKLLQYMLKLSSEALDEAWTEMVYLYSARSQSVSDDKIHALRGIIDRFQKISKDEYIAGFWKSQILQSLVWIRSGNIFRRPARSYPSWSWLSIDSPVQLNDCSEKCKRYRKPLDVEFVGYITKASSESFDRFGLLPEAVLHLRGYLLHIETPDWTNMRLFPTDPASSQFQWCMPEVARMTLDTVEDNDLATRSVEIGVVFSVWCLALIGVPVHDSRPGRGRTGEFVVEGLLLVEDHSNNQFRRIGRFCSNVGDEARFLTGPKRDICIR